MSRHGLLIDYEFCFGCHVCEIACKQEHDFPTGLGGITVSEFVTQQADKIHIDYVPFPTHLCDLCAGRTKRGELPSCVKHCQAFCMTVGSLEELSKEMELKSRSVLFSPR